MHGLCLVKGKRAETPRRGLEQAHFRNHCHTFSLMSVIVYNVIAGLANERQGWPPHSRQSVCWLISGCNLFSEGIATLLMRFSLQSHQIQIHTRTQAQLGIRCWPFQQTPVCPPSSASCSHPKPTMFHCPLCQSQARSPQTHHCPRGPAL